MRFCTIVSLLLHLLFFATVANIDLSSGIKPRNLIPVSLTDTSLTDNITVDPVTAKPAVPQPKAQKQPITESKTNTNNTNKGNSKVAPTKKTPTTSKPQPKKNTTSSQVQTPKKPVTSQAVKGNAKPSNTKPTAPSASSANKSKLSSKSTYNYDNDKNLTKNPDGTYTAISISNLQYEILESPEPTYPVSAMNSNYKDPISVTARFLVGLKGNVEKVEITRSQGNSSFNNEVIKTLKQWKFKPIYYKNKNIKVYFLKTFSFKTKNIKTIDSTTYESNN